MRQTVGKVLAETTSCVNIEHPWSGIITKFIRMRIKIQILKGEVGPILYWLLLAGSSHQIIKFIIFSSSYLFQAAVCLVNHHHQYHEHRHHLHDHHQQHHKGWVWFPTMQHQAMTSPQTSTTINLSSLQVNVDVLVWPRHGALDCQRRRGVGSS